MTKNAGLLRIFTGIMLNIAAFYYINHLFGYIGGQIRDTFKVMGGRHTLIISIGFREQIAGLIRGKHESEFENFFPEHDMPS